MLPLPHFHITIHLDDTEFDMMIIPRTLTHAQKARIYEHLSEAFRTAGDAEVEKAHRSTELGG